MREELGNDGEEEDEHARGDFSVAGNGHVHGIAGEVRGIHLVVVVVEAHYREGARAAVLVSLAR